MSRDFPTLLIVIALLVSCDVTSSIQEMKSENIRRGSEIVKEIEAYKTRTGTYPQSVEELERALSKTFPLPVAPAEPRWFYEATNDGYELSFSTEGKRRYPVWFYTSKEGRWHSDE